MPRKIVTFLLLVLLLALPARAAEVEGAAAPIETGGRTVASGMIGQTGLEDTLRWELDLEGTLIVAGKGEWAPWSWSAQGVKHPLKRLVIGQGVTSIPQGAFQGCESLEYVVIPGSVKIIGREAFRGCTGLTQLRITEGTQRIGEGAFQDCAGLRQVWLADSLVLVEEGSFQGTPWLAAQEDYIRSEHTLLRYLGSETSVTIPQGVTAIGQSCFRDCRSVQSITIPTSVERIEALAFEGTQWQERQGELVVVNGILVRYLGTEEELIISDGVRSVAPGAFLSNTTLRKLTLPEGCRTIGSYAFSGCSKLKTIQLPERMSRLGPYAFLDCSSLRSLSIPRGITRLEEGLFSGCRRLSELTIPEGVTALESYALRECDKLTELLLPESLTTIAPEALADAVGLTELHLPAAAVNVTPRSFFDTFGLRSITVAEGNEVFSAQNGLLLSKDGKTLIYCPSGRERDLTIPEGVEVIGSMAFYYNVRTQRIVLADSVRRIEDRAFLFAGITSLRIREESQLTYIGREAFAQCVSLSPLNLPEGLTYLGSKAFESCAEMTRLTIPGGVTHLYGPLGDYTYLKEVTFHGDMVWLAPNALQGLAEGGKVLVPLDSPAHWAAIRSGVSFKILEEMP